MIMCLHFLFRHTMRQFEEKETEWFCSATSNALVVRLESLVSILDVEECLLDAIWM